MIIEWMLYQCATALMLGLAALEVDGVSHSLAVTGTGSLGVR